MTELHELLEQAAGDEPPRFTTADVERRARRRSRRRRGGAGAAAAALVAVALTTWAVVDRADERLVVTGPGQTMLDDLLVGEWLLDEAGAVTAGPIGPLWRPTLAFEADGTVSGSLGCNTFGGAWTLEGSTLRTPERFATAAGCLDERMVFERYLEELLNSGPTVTVLDDVRRTIELRSGNRHATFVKVVVDPADLVDGHWIATDTGEGWPVDVVAHARVGPPSLHFASDGSVEGSSVCNGFSARWELEAGRLVVTERVGTYALCVGEEEFSDFLREKPQVWWFTTSPDRLILRGEDRWLEFTRITADDADDTDGVSDTAFTVLHTDRATGGHIGLLGAATNIAEFEDLWGAFGLTDEVPIPQMDFDRHVVVAIIIPDDACPPELVDIAVEGSVLTPAFRQPDGPCRLPLIPKVYVVALSHDLAPPGSVLRYPDDLELQIERRGQREIPIWPRSLQP